MEQPSKELLQKCCNDNRKAHYDLYRMCFSQLLLLCRRYYNNPDDVKATINLAFLKVIQGMDKYLKNHDNVPFELWVRKVTINTIIDEFRRQKKYKEKVLLVEEYYEEDNSFVIDPAVSSEKMEIITKAINQLPEMNKVVFNMFVIDGYKHEEIANVLEISVNTSKVHLHQAKEKLKKMLKEEWSIGTNNTNSVAI